jgi:alkaline phosphatase D
VVETVPEISAFRNNRAGSTRQNDFKRGASMASDTFWPIHQRIVAKKPAIIFYATEFGDLEPLIKSAGQYASQPYITHVLLGLFHLGYDNEDKTRPYIHLNNKNPDDPGYATLWEKVKIIQRRGVRVMGSLGGYGKRPNEDGVLDYTNFFTSDQTYQTFYQLLRDTLKKYNLDGLDLDIEEIAPWVNTANIRQLVRDLRNDFQGFQRGFLITSAPVASALTGGNNVSPNVDYPQLFEQFDFYLLQFYNSFGQLNPLKDHDSKTRPTYSEVADRYPDKEHKLIAGVLTNPKDGTHGYNLISTLSPILTNLTLSYRGFGGVFGWNYQNAVVDNNVKDPFGWAKSVWTALRMKPVPTTLEGEVEGAKTEE